MTRNIANVWGLISVLLFGLVVSAIRLVAEAFGAEIGAALLYTMSAIILVLCIQLPKINDISKTYIIVAGGLFVSYEICFSLAIGFSTNHRQTMEIGAINYLWPCLTVIFAILMNKEKASWFIFPATFCTFLGIFFVVSGDSIFDVKGLAGNILSNPKSYILMFTGAVLWAMYCNVTKKYGNGQNLIAIFFLMTAIVLWINVMYTHTFAQVKSVMNIENFTTLCFSSAIMAGGYALWNIGILRGNIVLLATCSNFIPILSAILSLALLSASLNYGFWIGVILVTLGSFIGFFAVKRA
ncbi:aromatic amino acid DMT transporter YddG [Acinetobacter sp. ME22]|uniref:aromatic amino acid DMT transporter YddG n=1 Tax=Acinetobacter sp. ME22 TaxID=2904802 RepID=UPI001EDB0D19|nr:aromatic amino acid DMT transporter YddG [Acinetobacter sp. ME22]MCG2574780.1 aromatic amino acid DMT transporter YddG [Acinetobacter sp. ME22]